MVSNMHGHIDGKHAVHLKHVYDEYIDVLISFGFGSAASSSWVSIAAFARGVTRAALDRGLPDKLLCVGSSAACPDGFFR